jgi:multidrug resistance efflux pump
MIRRILAFLVVVALLVALLAYSQIRRDPLEVSGFIEADEIRLGSRVGGRVDLVRCEEGQLVAAGDLLVALEEFDLFERQAEAKAQLAACEAELARLEHGLRPQEIAQAAARVDRLAAVLTKLNNGPLPAEIKAAKARVELAGAQVARAKRSYDRQADLFAQERGSVSQEDFDRATEALAVAEKHLEVRQQELELLQEHTPREEEILAAEADLNEARQAHDLAKSGFRSEDIDQARAARDAATAALAVVQAQIEELKIVSPVDGIIEAVELQKGDLVPPNAPVLSIMDTRHLWVRAYVPENRLRVQVNEEVSVTVDSYPDEHFRGRVSFISRQAEFTPNNVQTPEERSKQVFRIKVTLQEGLDRLRPGMPADVLLKP